MPQMYRVRAVSSGWAGGPGLNTFYFVNSADSNVTSSSGALDCATAVRTGFFQQAMLFPTQWQLQVSSVVDVLNPATGELTTSYGVAAPAPVYGSGGAAFGPIPAAIVVSMLTDDIVAGRRVRGRSFISPVVPGSDADGSPTAGILAAGRGIVGYMAGGTGGPPALSVWSRPVLADATVTPPVVGRAGSVHTVTATVARDRWGVLRSRRD